MSEQVRVVRERLAVAKHVVVLTGAGVSAESGVPTFRGKDGFWHNHRVEDLATPEAFQNDPRRVWEWYQWRRALIAEKMPNAAHEALAQLEKRSPVFLLITQNVDGLHGKAGSREMVELHGNIWKMRCTMCEQKTENNARVLPDLPKCKVCEGLLRPDIVWFGEAIDRGNLERSLDACQSCDLMLVIGTSGVVQPAASFASIAKGAGAFVVEINPVPSLSVLPEIIFACKAAELIPKIVCSP